MRELRAKRNKKAQKHLEFFGEEKSIIDSSQIVGGLTIMKFIKKRKARKVEEGRAAQLATMKSLESFTDVVK